MKFDSEKQFNPENTEQKKEKLKQLYKEMAELTLPPCKNRECGSAIPFSCCAKDVCENVIKYAHKSWGVKLEKTDNPKLPLIDNNGCIAEPHLRPSCAMHVCSIDKFGYTDDPGWTEKYYKLRSEIEKLERELL